MMPQVEPMEVDCRVDSTPAAVGLAELLAEGKRLRAWRRRFP